MRLLSWVGLVRRPKMPADGMTIDTKIRCQHVHLVITLTMHAVRRHVMLALHNPVCAPPPGKKGEASSRRCCCSQRDRPPRRFVAFLDSRSIWAFGVPRSKFDGADALIKLHGLFSNGLLYKPCFLT